MNPDSVIAVINFDMVGRSYNRKKKPYITGSVFSNIKQILNNSLLSYDSKKYGKDYFAEDQFQKEDLFYRSDNISFALNGIPAHIIMCSSPQDKYYHHIKDEAATLDYFLIYETIKAIATGCNSLVENIITPRRLNKKEFRKF